MEGRKHSEKHLNIDNQIQEVALFPFGAIHGID